MTSVGYRIARATSSSMRRWVPHATAPTPGALSRITPRGRGFTDRTYLARHLPPVANPQNLPDPAHVQRLFARPGGTQTLSAKSTCLFPAFAQYLTGRLHPHRPDECWKDNLEPRDRSLPLYAARRRRPRSCG